MEGQSYWNRMRDQRLSRRRALQGSALGGGALALIAAGCSSSSNNAAKPASSGATGNTNRAAAPSTASAGTPAPRSGGTIRLGTSAGVGNLIDLDPHVDTPVYAIHLRLIYQGLLGYDVKTWAVQPQLAKSWEQPGPTDFVFTLDPAAKWQNKPPANGRGFTADDAIYSFARLRGDNPRFTSASLLKDVKIQAPDASHVRMSTPVPDAAFLPKVSSDPFVMLARDVMEQAGPSADPGKISEPKYAVGTGPFEVTAFDPSTSGSYKKSANYWRPGRPYLDGVFTPYLHEYQEAYAGFQGGQIDVTIVPGQEAKSYIAKQGPNYQPLRAKEAGSLSFLAPNTKNKPFDDARVTRALRLLIDYNEIKTSWAETWYGAGRLSTYLDPQLDNWELSEDEISKSIFWKTPKDDAVKEALSLLSAAGFTVQNPLKFTLSGRQTPQDAAVIAQLVQSGWKRLSQGVVNVDLNLMETAVYQRARAARDYAYFTMTNASSYNDPDGWLQQIYYSTGSRNYYNNADPALDAQIDKERGIFDVDQRKKTVADILRYMIDHTPGVVMAYHYYVNATTAKVHDFAPEVQPQGQQYEWVWLSA